MAKIAVVLAGSGVKDGSEIHEATLSLLHIDDLGATYQCFAPDKPQHHVINHLKGDETAGESRRVLVEAARIARGDILPLSQLKASDYDAVVFPGGFGAAKNLCDYAFNGPNCSVDPDVERVIIDFHEAGKAKTFICIAPVIAAKVFGKRGVKVQVTVGNYANNAGDMANVTAMGAKAIDANVDEAVVDQANRVVSAPAYQLGPTIAYVSKGIRKAIEETIKLT